MRGMLMECSVHGLVEVDIGMTPDDGFTVTVGNPDGTGSFLAFCPVCGLHGPVLPGAYTGHGDHVHARVLLTDEQWTRLRTVLERIVVERPREPLDPIREISPELAAQIEFAVRKGIEVQGKPPSWRRRRQLAMTAAAAIYTVLSTDVSNLGDNLDTVSDAVGHVLSWVSEHGSVPQL